MTASRGRPKGQTQDRKSYGPLGDLIRKYRIEKSMGLSDVSKACQCSVQFISNIEHGRAPLPWDKAQKLSRVLEIPPAELEAANLAMRSDFQTFFGKSKKGWKGVASLVAMAKGDTSLRDVLERYNDASPMARKRFCQQAKDLLSTAH